MVTNTLPCSFNCVVDALQTLSESSMTMVLVKNRLLDFDLKRRDKSRLKRLFLKLSQRLQSNYLKIVNGPVKESGWLNVKSVVVRIISLVIVAKTTVSVTDAMNSVTFGQIVKQNCRMVKVKVTGNIVQVNAIAVRSIILVIQVNVEMVRSILQILVAVQKPTWLQKKTGGVHESSVFELMYFVCSEILYCIMFIFF